MRIEFLNYVIEVAKLGSISAAAKKMWLGTTSMSAIIKNVEDELNTEIFIRTPKGVILTDEGKELIPQMEKAVEDYRILCEMAASPSTHRSVCTLACYPALAPLLGPYVAKMVNRQPEYILSVKNTLSYRVIQAVSDGNADAGIATLPAGEYQEFEHFAEKNHLRIEQMCSDNFSLCIRGDSPLGTEKDVSIERIAEQQHCSASFFPQFTGSYPCIDYSLFTQRSVFDEMEAVKRMIASTNAVSLLPSIVFKNDIYVKSGLLKLIPLTGSQYELINALVYSNKPHLPHIVNYTIEAIRIFFKEYAGEKEETFETLLI